MIHNIEKAIARYIPMTGYVAQMIEEKEITLLPIKSEIPLYRGQEIEGVVIDNTFYVKTPPQKTIQ